MPFPNTPPFRVIAVALTLPPSWGVDAAPTPPPSQGTAKASTPPPSRADATARPLLLPGPTLRPRPWLGHKQVMGDLSFKLYLLHVKIYVGYVVHTQFLSTSVFVSTNGLPVS